MRTREELNDIVADILHELRKDARLSRNDMADRMSIDRRTYGRYESGEASPTLSVFLEMLESVDAPALPTIMRHLYPELFGSSTSVADHRRQLSDFILSTMPDRSIEHLYYIVCGKHGASLETQLQLLCALDHLQLDVRLAVAKLAYNFYDMESARGELINTDTAMPDMELLHSVLVKATQAAKSGMRSYNSVIK